MTESAKHRTRRAAVRACALLADGIAALEDGDLDAAADLFGAEATLDDFNRATLRSELTPSIRAVLSAIVRV